MSSDKHSLVGRSLGRYQLVRELGRGSMGVVYEGLDTRLARTVAIKTVQRSFMADSATAADYAARFEREAQAAARLHHPHIVALFDFGEQDDVSYIVMEFIRGHELAQAFRDGERFTLQQVQRLMTELLDALTAAHAHGIVHRDVKPANVLIDEQGHVKLADFGVARLADSNQDRTVPGTMVGTPSAMAPEQILGLAVGSRTDIFSAALIAYHLLTGQRPFNGSGPFDMQRAIVHDEPLAPSAVNPALPAAIDAVLAQALAKKPERRYASAAAFSAALNAALTGAKPLGARPAAAGTAVDLDLDLDLDLAVSAAGAAAATLAPGLAAAPTPAPATAPAPAPAPTPVVKPAATAPSLKLGLVLPAATAPSLKLGLVLLAALALVAAGFWALRPALPAKVPVAATAAPSPAPMAAPSAAPTTAPVAATVPAIPAGASPLPSTAASALPPPPPAVAARPAPTRAAENKPRPAADPRCADLLARIQLGDSLTPEQTTLFHTRCAR